MREPLESVPPAKPPSVFVDVALSVLLVMGYAAPLLGAVAFVCSSLVSTIQSASKVSAVAGGLGAISVAVFLGVQLYQRIRSKWRAKAVLAAEALVLLILPLWGLGYSHFLADARCSVTQCSAESTVFRPFAEPEIFGLLALHALLVLAYAASRRRPERLRPFAEALVAASLVAGAIVHALMAVHVGRWLGIALLLPPIFLPVLSPLLTIALLVVELRARLRRRGLEAALDEARALADSPYRAGPPPPLEARIHRGALWRAIALSPALLGAYAVLQALWLGHAGGALDVVTRTCGHVLSSLPVVVLEQDCHYLCTVAARGHPWLVRPERLGQRRGVTIVVNRQLAVANAFEDLLHERWPRFGRLARQIYDRFGLPLSRYLRRPWLADLTYLAMKPAEWLFALALLFLDRGDPERRIDRMYR
jgi:hypothetical protein